MKHIDYIRKMPQKISDTDMEQYLKEWCKWVHESIYRSYNILNMVKIMIKNWDSKETIQWIIEELENEKKH